MSKKPIGDALFCNNAFLVEFWITYSWSNDRGKKWLSSIIDENRYLFHGKDTPIQNGYDLAHYMVRILIEESIGLISKRSSNCHGFFSIHLLKTRRNTFIATMKEIVDKILDPDDDEYKKFPYPYVTTESADWNVFTDTDIITKTTDDFRKFIDDVFYPFSLVLHYFQ